MGNRQPTNLPPKAETIRRFGKNERDTGSAEVQIALLTDRINHLTEHLKQNDIERYRSLIAELVLRR